MTSDLERIKILEGKVSQVVEYINRIIGENEKLKSQLKELKAEKKEFDSQLKKVQKLDIDLKSLQSERELMKDKIESIISQIDQIGI